MSEEAKVTNSSPVSLLLRLYWILGCNAALSMMLIGGALGRIPIGITSIAIYCSVLVSAILARYIEIRSFNGETADNKPATMKDWSRYSVFMLLVFGVGAGFAIGIQKLTNIVF